MNEFLSITVLDDETADVEVRLPARHDVCPRCEGRGTHDHPAFANGITSSEWNGPDWDEESRERYMSGGYDVRCSTCDGKRVVLVPDDEQMSVEQKAQWEAHCALEAELARDEAMELRFGY